ncbi:hypothetical protein GUJ93_ZPchr0002g25735 [Zizania palustris]|uniref:Uncharacterized protein n=1 Tax=Zizania palustris TaxID=103762 RepID=A0A8J5RC55_ZIZPA|nr:hypothetical protein GUJ93_ZPchr0002g25735 [Zizania palustris]
MKASLKLREDGAPLLRAKLPVALLSVPAVASLTAGDPADLRLALATASPALPSLRLSYSPNRPSSPLSLSIVLGSGPGGCPTPSFSTGASVITMAVEVNTAGALSFSLVLKPSLGDFAVHKRFDTAGGGGSAPTTSAATSAASEVTMRSAIPVRGGAAAVSVRWGVRIPAEVTAGGAEGAAALALRRLPFLVLGKVTVERSPPPLPASRKASTQEETSVEKTRKENEKLRRELDELRASATEKMEKGTSTSTTAGTSRRSSGWRSPEMAGDWKAADVGRRKDEVPGYDDRDASTSAAAPPLGPAQTKRRTPQKKLASKRKKRLAPEVVSIFQMYAVWFPDGCSMKLNITSEIEHYFRNASTKLIHFPASSGIFGVLRNNGGMEANNPYFFVFIYFQKNVSSFCGCSPRDTTIVIFSG